MDQKIENVTSDQKIENVTSCLVDALGIKPEPAKVWWKPECVRQRQKENQDMKMLSQWELVPDRLPSQEEVNMATAQQLRDWAEMLVGHCHIDREKSSIVRKRIPNMLRGFVQNLKYDPPKGKKKLSKKQMLRQAVREGNKMASVEIKT